MKIHILLLLFLILLLSSCKEFKFDYPFWCDRNNMIQHNDKSVYYWTCNDTLYYATYYYVFGPNPSWATYTMMDLKPSEFRVIDQRSGYDSKNMFSWYFRRGETDSQTYEKLNDRIDRDKNNYYCDDKIIKWIKDIESFELTGITEWKDKFKIYTNLCWWKRGDEAISLLGDSANYIQFENEVSKNEYSKDNKSLYYLWKELKWKYDIDTIELVQSEAWWHIFFKDKKNIFKVEAPTWHWSERLLKIEYKGSLENIEIIKWNSYRILWLKDKVNNKLYCYATQKNDKKFTEMIWLEANNYQENEYGNLISTNSVIYESYSTWCDWRLVEESSR